MSEEIKETNTQDNETNNSSAEKDVNTVATEKENMIPYSRFKEVNDNYKNLKAQLDELTSNKAVEELEAKKQAGQFEELYNTLQSEHEPLKAQVTQYKELIDGLLQSKLEQVPEEYKDLIPEGLDDLSKLKWIENAVSKGLFGNNSQVKSFGNKGSNPAPVDSITKDQFAKMTYSERVKLMQENKALYEKLAK